MGVQTPVLLPHRTCSLSPAPSLFLFWDLVITCLEMKAFQKHLSHQFSAGNVHKNRDIFIRVFLFSRLLLPAMGNYKLLPSVSSSCKNSLPREMHFHSNASLSRPDAGWPHRESRREREAVLKYTWSCGPALQPGVVGCLSFLFYFS